MITRLAEINRILVALEAICDEGGAAPVDALIEKTRQIAVESRRPDHETTIAFGKQLSFLAGESDAVQFTDIGRDFLILNPDRTYDLQPDQCQLILRTSYLHGPYREQTRLFLKTFTPDYASNTYRWSPEANDEFRCEPWVPLHLRELGLVMADTDGNLSIVEAYAGSVSDFLSEGKGFSEEKLMKFLEEKREKGAIAEALVKAKEVERLRKAGFIKESRSVRLISTLNESAGYDLESYDAAAPAGMRFNRFIEIKGSGSETVHFFWSPNEMDKARELGDRYWIYFQGGIDRKAKTARNELLVFRDPIKTILADANFKQTPNGFLIEAAKKGARIA